MLHISTPFSGLVYDKECICFIVNVFVGGLHVDGMHIFVLL